MNKVFLYSLFLVLGLVISQLTPSWLQGDGYASFKTVLDALLYICLAYVMINVGREFELNKSRWREYTNDYFIAMATAALPWLFVALYYIIVLLPPGYFGNGDAWKESLLLSRFAAPTSAGILFTMLIVCGLKKSWIYRKIQILAIFDDLDTVLLMIPLQILMIGMHWEIGGLLVIVLIILILGWQKMSYFNWRQEWWDILIYAILVFAITWAIDHFFKIHIEVLLPAFVLGMIMKHKESHRAGKRFVATFISLLFMFLVGMSMPCFSSFGAAEITETTASRTTLLSSQPMLSWGIIAIHVMFVTILSNIGKLVPLFFYRDRLIEERLAVSVGMFIRGEVGAGVIFIAIGYNIGGPALIISILTLVVNLVLTGFFIAIVKKMAFKASSKYKML